MKSSDWDYVDITEDIVFIKDLNLGGKSVTNDAENVYETIKKSYPDKRIVYQDSNGDWEEMLVLPGVVYFRIFNGDIHTR